MATADEQRAQQKTMWGVAATAWERWDDLLERSTAPLTAWLIDRVGIAPGMHTLDLASGAGQPAASIAARVTPGGRVVASDLTAEMVAVVRRKAERLGLDNLEAREMSADAIDFPDASFDAVTMRFGLMFVPEPARATAEVRRVLRPGGRFAVCVWDEPARNPFFTTMAQVMARFMGGPPPNPRAPGPFRLAPPGDLEAALRAGGFTDVQVETVAIESGYDSVEQYWTTQTELAAPLRAALARMSDDERARIRDEVFAAVAPRVTGGRLVFPSSALCATAA